MGKLAAWGALAGLGKGMIANAEYQRKVDFAALEETREMRLREYEAEQAASRQQAGFDHDKTMLEEGKKWDVTMEATRQGGQTAQALLSQGFEDKSREDTQSFTAEENRKKRESDEAQTRLQVEARDAAKGADKEKWTIKASPRTRKGFDKKNPLAEETAPQYSITSPTGVTYIQVGDQFVLPGEGEPKAVPRGVDRIRNVQLNDAQVQQAETILRQRPDTAELFIQRFGYLPLWFARTVKGTTDADAK